MTKVRHPNAGSDKEAQKARRRLEEFERARKPSGSDRDDEDQSNDEPPPENGRDRKAKRAMAGRLSGNLASSPGRLEVVS
jgi:hypothetical protein